MNKGKIVHQMELEKHTSHLKKLIYITLNQK